MDFATYLNEMNNWGMAGTPASCKTFVQSNQITKEQFNQIFHVDYDSLQPIPQNGSQNNESQSNTNNGNGKLFNNQPNQQQ